MDIPACRSSSAVLPVLLRMVSISLLACLPLLSILIAAHCLCQQARTVPQVSSSSSALMCALTNKLMANCMLCYMKICVYDPAFLASSSVLLAAQWISKP